MGLTQLERYALRVHENRFPNSRKWKYAVFFGRPKKLTIVTSKFRSKSAAKRAAIIARSGMDPRTPQSASTFYYRKVK